MWKVIFQSKSGGELQKATMPWEEALKFAGSEWDIVDYSFAAVNTSMI